MPTKSELPLADKARLIWLLDFLRADLSQKAMPPGALLDWRNQVFANLHESSLATVTAPDDPDLAALKPAYADERDPTVALARDLLTRVQFELLEGVKSLEQSGSWQPFGITPGSGPLWSWERRSDGQIVKAYCGKWSTITLATASDLLLANWSQLRRCAYSKCRALFLPKENREIYHDRKCSANKRWSDFSPKRDHQREKERRILKTGPGRGRRRKQR